MNPLISYGFLFIGVGAALYGGYQAALVERSFTWPRATGKVLRSQVVSSGNGPGHSSYDARVEYRYSVEGRAYHGKTLSIGGHVGTTAKVQQGRCDAYPVGSEVTVTLEVEAKLPDGASEQIVRTVTENSRTLKFTNQGFESD